MIEDPTDTEAQERSQAEAQERNRLKATVEVDDLKWLMSSKRGRRIVHRQLVGAGVWRLSFHTNALQMAFNEGTRNQGLALVAQITDHCSERYAEMLEEAKNAT